jgi:hypothetical protein
MRKSITCLISPVFILVLFPCVTMAQPLYFPLLAGQHIDVGQVIIQESSVYTFSVTYSTDPPWCLTETHLHVAGSLEDIPQNKKHNPRPGHFAEGEEFEFEPCVEEATYGPFPFSAGDEIYIAAHAVVERDIETPVELYGWGRSSESPGGIAYGPTQGSAVSDGLALPIDVDQIVWNKDEYQEENNVPETVEYATWDQWQSECRSTFEVRHFQAFFDLPGDIEPSSITSVILHSTHDYGIGDIIPINDNLYVYINDNLIGAKGTGYSDVYRDNELFPQTDGWYVPGSFEVTPGELLEGQNKLDIVAEELCAWGGIDQLGLKLIGHQRETAWGDGTRFTDKGNWATYIHITLNPPGPIIK